MKKIVLSLLCLSVVFFMATGLFGCNKQEENIQGSFGLEYSINPDGKSCTVTGMGDCTDSNIIIPDKSPEGYLVTAIGEGSFALCYDIMSIAIPKGLTEIGEAAFAYCNFSDIYITDLTAWCRISGIANLMGEMWGDKNLYLNEELITDLIIPDDIKIIGEYTFDGCGSLKSVKIHDDVARIDDCAFRHCVGITEIDIPDGVAEIGEYAFYGCYNIESVTIPETVKRIGRSAFEECGGLKNIYISDLETWLKISGLGNLMFNKSFNKRLYLNGEEIFEIELPNGTETISDYAFYGCSRLTKVTIPDSILNVGIAAFEGCTNLEYNVFDEGIYLGNNDNPYTVLIRANDFSTVSYKVNEDTKIIYERAFAGCNGFTDIIISGGVRSIGYCAFEGCSGLTSVTIPDSVINMGEGVFSNCSGLTSVTVGRGVRSIGYCVFEGCSGLTSVTIPNTVTSVEGYAFLRCRSLTEIRYEGTVEEWRSITDEDFWFHAGDLTVYCKDGSLTKEEA